MAVRRWFNCSPEQVFAVLHDGWTYPVWVVGASRMRDVDAGWPAPGTTLHHSFGVWPLLIDDTTEAIEIEPGQRLVLEARGWPVGKARVGFGPGLWAPSDVEDSRPEDRSFGGRLRNLGVATGVNI